MNHDAAGFDVAGERGEIEVDPRPQARRHDAGRLGHAGRLGRLSRGMVSRGKPSDRDMRGLWRRRKRRLWLGRRKVFELRSVRECGAGTAPPQQQRRTAAEHCCQHQPDEHRRPPVRGRRCGDSSGRGESWLGQLGRRRRGRQSDRLRRGCRERGARLRGRSSRSTSRRRRRSRPRLRAADRAGLGWRGRRGAHRSRRGSARRWRRRRLLRRPGDRSGKAEILKLARPDRLGRGRVGRRRASALRERGRLAERQSRRQYCQPQAQTRSHRLPLMP